MVEWGVGALLDGWMDGERSKSINTPRKQVNQLLVAETRAHLIGWWRGKRNLHWACVPFKQARFSVVGCLAAWLALFVGLNPARANLQTCLEWMADCRWGGARACFNGFSALLHTAQKKDSPIRRFSREWSNRAETLLFNSRKICPDFRSFDASIEVNQWYMDSSNVIHLQPNPAQPPAFRLPRLSPSKPTSQPSQTQQQTPRQAAGTCAPRGEAKQGAWLPNNNDDNDVPGSLCFIAC
jgi:hypothetical protein